MPTQNYNIVASAIEQTDDEKEFNDIINDQLENLDANDVDKIINELDDQTKTLFGNKSFIDKIKDILNGEFGNDSGSILEYIFSLIFSELLSFLPIIAIIISVAILGSMMQGLKPKSNGESIANIINFVIYGIVVVLIFGVFSKLFLSVLGSINSIKSQMDVVFPILLTLLTSIGGTVSVGVYQPAMAVLSNVIINVFISFLFPLFILYTVLTLVNNLSTSIKLDKMTGFISSLFKWTIGIIFTIFLGFASMQGLTAGSIDGLSIKTAKYTLKSYIPIVGGYMADGIFLVLAGCNLIKNAVGLCGLLLIFSTLISPLIEIIVLMLALKFVSAIVEPLGNGKLASLISGLAKALQMLIAMVASVLFMYILLVGLVMCSANII